jgi:hypothetical protein
MDLLTDQGSAPAVGFTHSEDHLWFAHDKQTGFVGDVIEPLPEELIEIGMVDNDSSGSDILIDEAQETPMASRGDGSAFATAAEMALSSSINLLHDDDDDDELTASEGVSEFDSNSESEDPLSATATPSSVGPDQLDEIDGQVFRVTSDLPTFKSPARPTAAPASANHRHTLKTSASGRQYGTYFGQPQ